MYVNVTTQRYAHKKSVFLLPVLTLVRSVSDSSGKFRKKIHSVMFRFCQNLYKDLHNDNLIKRMLLNVIFRMFQQRAKVSSSLLCIKALLCMS